MTALYIALPLLSLLAAAFVGLRRWHVLLLFGPLSWALYAYVGTPQIFALRQQQEQIVPALRQAVLQSKGDPEMLLLYAKALIEQKHGNVSEEARQAIEMALLQTPKNLQARYLMALYESQHGDTKKAAALLDALLKELPENIPFTERVKELRDSLP